MSTVVYVPVLSFSSRFIKPEVAGVFTNESDACIALIQLLASKYFIVMHDDEGIILKSTEAKQLMISEFCQFTLPTQTFEHCESTIIHKYKNPIYQTWVVSMRKCVTNVTVNYDSDDDNSDDELLPCLSSHDDDDAMT